jgi:hypothetical protein
VEHPSSLDRPFAWRKTALVAAGIATLELLLLVLVGLAILTHRFDGGGGEGALKRERAAGKRGGTAKAPVPVAKLPRSETSVIVFNGNGLPGAAGEAADLIRSLRYLIAGTANAPRTDFARSIVMFRPGYRGEAARLARDLRIRRVAPLDGLRPADLQGAQVALIVGRS